MEGADHLLKKTINLRKYLAKMGADLKLIFLIGLIQFRGNLLIGEKMKRDIKGGFRISWTLPSDAPEGLYKLRIEFDD